MLDQRSPHDGTDAAILGSRTLLESGSKLVGDDCGNLLHGSVTYRLADR